MSNEEQQNNKTTGSGSVGALWGTFIVMVLLLVGAFYTFNQKVNLANQATIYQIENTSDEIESIEEDYNMVDVEKIDSEINSI